MPMTTSSSEYLLDTNILVYFVHLDSVHHRSSRESVELLEREGHLPVFTPQNAVEFWAVATKPTSAGGLGYLVDEARAHLEAFGRRFEFLPETPHLFHAWLDVVHQYGTVGRNVFDARLAAAMSLHRIPKIVTENFKDFKRYPFLTPLAPKEILAGMR
jgi:predicted nucleic acid-binding protein